MEVFNPDAKCAKCGHDVVSTMYGSDDKLIRTCKRCGHYWAELPLDAQHHWKTFLEEFKRQTPEKQREMLEHISEERKKALERIGAAAVSDLARGEGSEFRTATGAAVLAENCQRRIEKKLGVSFCEQCGGTIRGAGVRRCMYCLHQPKQTAGDV